MGREKGEREICLVMMKCTHTYGILANFLGICKKKEKTILDCTLLFCRCFSQKRSWLPLLDILITKLVIKFRHHGTYFISFIFLIYIFPLFYFFRRFPCPIPSIWIRWAANFQKRRFRKGTLAPPGPLQSGQPTLTVLAVLLWSPTLPQSIKKNLLIA